MKNEIKASNGLAIPLLGIYPKEMPRYVHQKMFTRMFSFSYGSHRVERCVVFSSPHLGVCSSTDTSVLRKGGAI